MPIDIDEAIREKRAKIEQYQAELDVLLKAKTLLTAPQDAGERAMGRRAPHQPIKPVQSGMAPKTSVEHAIAALREAGTPMHVNQIVEWANAHGAKIHKPTLTGNLVRLLKNPDAVFTKAGPNIYGLRDYSTNGAHPPTSNGADGLSEGVLSFLKERQGQSFDALQVANALGLESKLHSIRSALQRLEGRKRIQRAARGQYGVGVQRMQ